MTAPSPCDRLDAYLDGRLAPDEEAAFEAHLAACETCLEEPVLPDDLRADLAAVTCPPAVVAGALRQARRAPDRAPRAPSRPHWQRVGWVAAALLAVVTALWTWPGSAPTETLTVAERDTPERSGPRVEAAPESTAPPTAPDPISAPAVVPTEESSTPPPDERTPPPARPRRSSAPPTAAPVDPSLAPDALVAEATAVSPDSVAAAREDVLLALAIVGDAQGRAAGAVADGVGRVSDALHLTPHLLSPRSP